MAWVTFLIINNSSIPIPIIGLKECKKFNLIERHGKCISMIIHVHNNNEKYLYLINNIIMV